MDIAVYLPWRLHLGKLWTTRINGSYYSFVSISVRKHVLDLLELTIATIRMDGLARFVFPITLLRSEWNEPGVHTLGVANYICSPE